MKITEKIKKADETLLSFEILPPLKGQGIETIFKTLDPLLEFKPSFIDVTYHREEYVYKQHENGLLERKSVRKRPGTVGICAAIKNKFEIDTVPHIICGGFSKEETENALIDLDFLGIDNVLLLRGDPIKSESSFVAEKDGHAYASDLIQQVVAMNNGQYLDDELQGTSSSNYCIGVAGYPEKHFESPNQSMDLHYLKQKIDLGADYIVSQMFFDNQVYFDFVDACRNEGITVPIIPGLKLITSKKQLTTLPRHFHVDIPDDFVNQMMNAKSKEEELALGKNHLKKQSEELIEAKVPVIHYYIMSQSNSIVDVLKNLF